MKVNKLSKVFIISLIVLFILSGCIISNGVNAEGNIGENNMASGNLGQDTTTSTSIKVNYVYNNARYVHLSGGGDEIRIGSGSGYGSGSGSHTYTGLSPNTSYEFELTADDFAITLCVKTFKTSASGGGGEPPPPPPPPPKKPSGTLSAEATGATTASLNYSYKRGTSVSLFRGSTKLQTFGSGNGSGVYEDSELEPETEYTYYLRNGTSPSSTKLAQATINTPELPSRGTLSAQPVDSDNIDLTYTFADCENASLFRGSTKIKTFGSGAGSGVYRDTDLNADTSYTYYLRNGTSEEDDLLDSDSASTLEEPRQSVIRQGRVLPLTSQVTIFDTTLTRIGIMEDYEYLSWLFKYRNFGNFKLLVNRYKANTEYLSKGNVLSLYVAGYYRAAIIESIEIGLTEQGKISENYIIMGRGLGGLFAERIALNDTDGGTGYDSQNTFAETAMRHYINLNCMDADNADRNYPLLYLEDPDGERGGNIKYDARFQYINELLEEISLASGLGWEVILDSDNKRMVFQIIEGVDRSSGNGENSVVMFSPKFGNIRLLNYMDSNLNSKNVTYLGGQGEADERTVVEVAKDEGTYTGTGRREYFIDARDLDDNDKLTQRGNERLADLGEEKVLEIENLSTGPFDYGIDFYLGDIVTVIYPDIVEADLRVIESIIEISPENLIQNKLIFGKKYPDLISIGEYKNKNFYPEMRR